MKVRKDMFLKQYRLAYYAMEDLGLSTIYRGIIPSLLVAVTLVFLGEDV